jgi:putative hydrolase of the HAD superfamily
MLIRAVLFDLGNTLVSYHQPADFMPVLRRSLDACLLALGHDPLQREAQTALLHEALELNQERADLAVWPLEQRLRVLFGGYTPDGAMIGRLCSAFLDPIFSTAQVSAQTLPVLAGLKQIGIRTAVVSNTPWGSSGRAWRSELARHGLLSMLDAVVFCTDVGWRKPHPTPFRRALEILDISAAEAVFVGDDPLWDVEGAQSAGLRPILLTTPDNAETATDPASISAQVTVASSLADVLAKVSQWNAPASAGPQPALA